MISKAEAKRQKDAYNSVHSLITRTLAQFKNNCIEAAGVGAVRKLEIRKEKIADGTISPGAGWTKEKAIENLTKRLKLSTLISLEAMNESKEGFEARLDKMAQKCVQHGITSRFLKIEEVRHQMGQFEFLVVGEHVDVHARAIFVHGIEVESHYRFITTKRKK